MRLLRVLLVMAFVCVLPVTAQLPDTVTVTSSGLRLKALVWRPQGTGNRPAVLFTHGSECDGGPGSQVLAEKFVAHGYFFVLLHRRGYGLSASQGECAAELLTRERAQRGDEARASLQYRLMTVDHFDDILAGLAFLKEFPGVDSTRLVVAGASFGAQLAILAAEHDPTLKAALNFAGAAQSWSGSADLRQRLLIAAERSAVPMFIAHAANDFSVEPGTVLAAAMEAVGRPHQLVIYPPVGENAAQGHRFVFLAPDLWETDVFNFLTQHVPN